ncbi:protein melted-like isoform X2 [Penaeus japonicus]|nr:protein melted-like isoform X2 [Penaeus japonicus]XP_042868476.1 protein melted-like isoform X2 [Penaeus japonicus]XP_042868477.1 protein melted-like isoform X2 [Penaeus japonicus]
MHELFTQVLSHKDLSKAGDLFNVSDHVIVNDLTDVINKIREIASLPEYTRNDNDQSVVEICITRVTSAIRETGSIEQHAEALVALLQTCLNHNLRPSSRDSDPPHAKIASDVVSCIFLNYHKREVMALALPVAVKFLHKGNKELSRNMSSYLSLAAIEAADLLAMHIQPIIDSVISGNYSLSRVLPQIYAVKKEPIHDHVMTLVSLLPQCDTNEKLGLLMLFSLVAKNRPALLEPSLPQLVECLSISGTSMATLQIFVELCSWRPGPFTEHVTRLKSIIEQQPHCLALALQVMAAVGRLSKEKGKSALDYIAQQLPKVDSANLGVVLREVQVLCSQYPALLVESESLLTAVNKCMDRANVSARVYIQQLNNEYNEIRNTNVNHTPGGVTIVRVGGGGGNRTDTVVGSSRTDISLPSRDLAIFQPHTSNSSNVGKFGHKYQKHSDTSRSTGRLVTASNRSMPRLNALPQSTGRLGSSTIQLDKSMTRISSSHGLHMNRSITVLAPPSRLFSGHLGPSSGHLPGSAMGHHMGGSQVGGSQIGGSRLVSSPPPPAGVPMSTVSPLPGTVSPAKSMSSSLATLREGTGELGASSGVLGSHQSQATLLPPDVSQSTAVTHTGHHTLSLPLHLSSRELAPSTSPAPVSSVGSVVSHLRHSQSPLSLPPSTASISPAPTTATTTLHSPTVSCVTTSHAVATRSNTTLTHITHDPHTTTTNACTQRISVFEPFAMRDTVQHFCEKHLDKIKAYMQKVFVKLPLPIRCGIEERKNKKHAKLYFACQGKGEHCLYSKHFFTMKTRNPRIWIHLMFLALQARSSVALSTRETQVSSLKNCWDILKCDTKTFVTLVTSAFPSAKDMDMLLHELRNARFFDVFEYNGVEQQWGCFLCNHPDRARGFVDEDTPVIEGQLKEKKSKWKIFRRWRTRYFTLSGAHLSYRGAGTEQDKVEEKGGIDVHQIRSVKVNRGGSRHIPKAFEIFTDNKSFVLKAKDSSNAEEWVRCLSIVVAHSHSREEQTHGAPKTTTSIPRSFMYGHHSSTMRTAV